MVICGCNLSSYHHHQVWMWAWMVKGMEWQSPLCGSFRWRCIKWKTKIELMLNLNVMNSFWLHEPSLLKRAEGLLILNTNYTKQTVGILHNPIHTLYKNIPCTLKSLTPGKSTEQQSFSTHRLCGALRRPLLSRRSVRGSGTRCSAPPAPVRSHKRTGPPWHRSWRFGNSSRGCKVWPKSGTTRTRSGAWPSLSVGSAPCFPLPDAGGTACEASVARWFYTLQRVRLSLWQLLRCVSIVRLWLVARSTRS